MTVLGWIAGGLVFVGGLVWALLRLESQRAWGKAREAATKEALGRDQKADEIDRNVGRLDDGAAADVLLDRWRRDGRM